MRSPITIFILSLPLGACATSASADYPSLDRRPIETRFAVAESVPLALPGALPTDLAGRTAQWRARSAEAEAAFAAALPAVDAAIAAAQRAPVASEPWIAAQQALSRLAITRGPVADALADVDALYIARQDGDQIDGLPDILALRDALAATLARQNDALAARAARLAD